MHQDEINNHLPYTVDDSHAIHPQKSREGISPEVNASKIHMSVLTRVVSCAG